MEFGFDKGPHLKDIDHTHKIMRRLSIVLFTIALFAIYKNGVLPFSEGYTNFYGLIKPLLMIVLASLTSVVTEIIYFRYVQKKKGEDLIKHLKESYAIFPGLFLALCLPINTPLWLILLGAFVATFLGKLLFGGFGYNIFNPALIGVIVVLSSYGALIASQGGYLNPLELDTIAGATPLSNLSNLKHVGTADQIIGSFGTLWDFFLGFIPGSLGETNKLFILIGFIYLTITKVIKWIIPVTYVGVVFLMTAIIGFANDMSIWYALFSILSGGLLFGAVFMATDPVTSPTTRTGQILYGLGLGLLTVLFRYLTPYPEGVLTAILTMNMIVFILDRIGAKSNFNKMYGYIPIGILTLVIIFFTLYTGDSLKSEPSPVNKDFNIYNVTVSGPKTIYEVSQTAFHGSIKANVTIENNEVTAIDIIYQEETYWSEIIRNDYLNKLKGELSSVQEIDTISGATVSSKALKDMILNVLKDYEVKE